MSGAEPTVAEQYMLALINRARANPAAEAVALGIDLNEGLAPGTLTADAKQPLAFNPQLVAAARAHSQWMVQTDVFAHNEGSVDPGDQMRAAGYPFVGSWTWGQNIAFRGQTGSNPDLMPTVAKEEDDLFVDAGIDGRGHRLNLLDDHFKEIGVGAATGVFQGYNAVLTSQDFAAESGNSFLTGVAFTDAAGTHFYKPGEGLGSITITATRASDQAVFTTTTWAAGGYSLALAPGTYEVAASGAGLGTVSAGNVVIGTRNLEVDFTPATDGTNLPVDPPVVPVANGFVAGTVFKDRNGNGARDPGEPGLAKWRVFADINEDGYFQPGEPSVLTNARGAFRLTLQPGSYVIRELVKRGFTQVVPADADAATSVDVTVGATTGGLTFADRPAPAKKKAACVTPRRLATPAMPDFVVTTSPVGAR